MISGAPNDQVPVDYREFRKARIKEEYDELMEAIDQNDLVKIARESVDLIYVVIGTLVAYGIPFIPCWRAVHRANMKKEAEGSLAKPKKPIGWVSPDVHITAALREASVHTRAYLGEDGEIVGTSPGEFAPDGGVIVMSGNAMKVVSSRVENGVQYLEVKPCRNGKSRS
jgi:hypothetical protein